MMRRLLAKWAEPVTRRQLQRALAARNEALAELADAGQAIDTLTRVAERWKSAAVHATTELRATEQMLRVALADEVEQGDPK